MSEDTGGESQTTSEPEFRAFRKRLLTGGRIICIVGLPIGIALGLPYVWGLSIVGIAVTSIKLAIMKTLP